MPHRIRAAALVGVIFAFLLAAFPAAARPPGRFSAGPNAIERISTGAQGQGGGFHASVSSDSRYFVFESTAPDVVPGHIEDSWDVFLYDRQSGSAERVSTTSEGQPVYNSGAYSSPPAIASGGRHVAFMSNSANLIPGDDNGLPDIFYHDQSTGVTRLVSVASDGASANGPSFQPAISADGRYVAFRSFANNLVEGDTNDALDVFVRDLQAGITQRVSVTSDGQEGYDIPDEMGDMLYSPIAISDGGRWIAFAYEYLPVSGQNGEVGPRIYLHNRENGSTRFVATGDYPALSGTGRYLTFVSFEPLVEDDRNNIADVYFLDINLAVDVFERISVTTAGEEAAMQDIESAPDVTDDGQYVVFSSNGGLVSSRAAGVFHIYLRNRATGVTTLVSRNANGVPANGDSVMPVIAGDGRCVAFSSQASDLVDGDTNGSSDVFVFDRTAPGVASMDYIYHLPVIGGRRR